MLEVFNKKREKLGILQNAFDIKEEKKLNSIYHFYFSLPYNDFKNSHCEAFNYIRYDNGELYRIINKSLNKSENGSITYTCEHVIATLFDKILFGYSIDGNKGVNTSKVINNLLSRQNDWRLGECDFKFEYEYGWEQENLLSALFSIPKPFVDKYIWKYDTTSYPWKVSLKKINENADPELYIYNKKNMLNISKQSDLRDICTRIYPLGYGEGVNQLNISKVNNGKLYIESPPDIIKKYGIIERSWIDRRYEDALSLKQAAISMLNELQEPITEYTVDYAQVSKSFFDKAEVGKIVKIVDSDLKEEVITYVTAINFDYSEITKSSITIANKPKDISDTIADLADRQRIEMAYSQGATQIYSQTLQANADKKSGAIMDFYIPKDMRIINKVIAKVKLGSFRAYSKATEAAEINLETTESEIIDLTTTESETINLNTTESEIIDLITTDSGGECTSGASSTETTSTEDVFLHITSLVFDGDHFLLETNDALDGEEKHHHLVRDHTHVVEIDGHNHNMDHTHDIKAHYHGISMPAHAHIVRMPAHAHIITMPEHKHKLKIPKHEHEITPGIYFYGVPRSFDLYVNGVYKKNFKTTAAEIDLTEFLLNSENTITRDEWKTIEIRPNDLSYISINLFVQGFVQSRGDLTV